MGGYGLNEGEISLCVNGLALNCVEWANGWYEWDRPRGPGRVDEWAEPMFPVRPNLLSPIVSSGCTHSFLQLSERISSPPIVPSASSFLPRL